MKLPPRERRQVWNYENDVDSGFPTLILGLWKKKATKKPKAAKKASAPKAAKKTAKKTNASANSNPFAIAVPTLTRQQSNRRNALYAEGSRTHKWQFMNDFNQFQDYDKAASDLVEMEYSSWQVTPSVSVRSVHSGDWDYSVDFNALKQRNLRHHAHKERKIQRVPVQ